MPQIPRPLKPLTNPSPTSNPKPQALGEYVEPHLQEGWSDTCDICGDKTKCRSSIAYQRWTNYCNKCWVKHFLPDYQQKLRDNAANSKTAGKASSRNCEARKAPAEEDDAN